jgi:hypothetical protein
MSLPPDLQLQLGHERSASLSSGRASARTFAARGSAVAAVRNRVGRMVVSAGRRIMGESAIVDRHASDVALAPFVK